MRKLIGFLRKRREQLNYTQEYIAHRLGVTSSSISRWENGQASPNFSRLELYAHEVGLEENEMFAILASEDNVPPLPIAEIHLSVFSKDAYAAVMKAIAEQGVAVSVESKRLRKWT